MPVNLEPRDVSADLAEFKSVLIVSCPVCPPMCLAMETKTPMFEIFKRGLKTAAFEDYVQSIRAPLEQHGVKTGVYAIHTPTPMMCLWTDGQRRRLLKRAEDYEAVLVLGCDSATTTVEDALRRTNAQVIQGMEMGGIVNAKARIRFPLVVELEKREEPETVIPRRRESAQSDDGASAQT